MRFFNCLLASIGIAVLLGIVFAFCLLFLTLFSVAHAGMWSFGIIIAILIFAVGIWVVNPD